MGTFLFHAAHLSMGVYMPRINIEEKWWSDPRRGRLADKLGRRYADGLMMEAWRLSQEFNGESFEWKPYFEKHEVEALASVCLADAQDELIYIKGSKEHHDWITKKRQSAMKGGMANKRRINNLPEANASECLADAKPSSSSSSSSSCSKKKYSVRESAVPTPVEKNTSVQKFIGEYIGAFQKRYGNKVRPDLRGKVQGQIKRYVSEIPLDEAIQKIQVYFQLDDPWFLTKCHDFTTFLENQSKINISLQTGKTTQQISKENKSLSWAKGLYENKRI